MRAAVQQNSSHWLCSFGSPRWHTPVIAILSQGVCAMVMTFTPIRDLLTYIGMSLTFFSVMAVASLFVFRGRRPDWQRLRALQVGYLSDLRDRLTGVKPMEPAAPKGE